MSDNPFEMFVNNKEEEDFFFAHLNKDAQVLEWGSGKSTLAIARRVHKILSIEHNHEYYEFTRKILSENNIDNAQVIFCPPNNPSYQGDGSYPDFMDYVEIPQRISAELKYPPFDVIFIDGRSRVACAEFAVNFSLLKKDGLIFIHDYRHPENKYRRVEYEVVEDFLDMLDKKFTMAKFKIK